MRAHYDRERREGIIAPHGSVQVRVVTLVDEDDAFARGAAPLYRTVSS